MTKPIINNHYIKQFATKINTCIFYEIFFPPRHSDFFCQVPYFESEEECLEVPFDVCSLVEEEVTQIADCIITDNLQVPTKVCTLVDDSRESKVLAKKELKRDRNAGGARPVGGGSQRQRDI